MNEEEMMNMVFCLVLKTLRLNIWFILFYLIWFLGFFFAVI